MDEQPAPINKIIIRILALARALTIFKGFKNKLPVFIEFINIGKIEIDNGAVGEKRKVVRLAKNQVLAIIFDAQDFLQADGTAGFFVFRLFRIFDDYLTGGRSRTRRG